MIRSLTRRVKTPEYNAKNIDSLVEQAQQKSAELLAIMDVLDEVVIRGKKIDGREFSQKLNLFSNKIESCKKALKSGIQQVAGLDLSPEVPRAKKDTFNGMKKTI